MNFVHILDIIATVIVGLSSLIWFGAVKHFLKKQPEFSQMIRTLYKEIWTTMPYKGVLLAVSTVSGLLTVALFHWIGFVLFSTAILASSVILLVVIGYMIWSTPAATPAEDKGWNSF